MHVFLDTHQVDTLRMSCRTLSVIIGLYLKCPGDILPGCRLPSNWLPISAPTRGFFLPPTPLQCTGDWSYLAQRRTIKTASRDAGRWIQLWNSMMNDVLNRNTSCMWIYIKHLQFIIIEPLSKVKVLDKEHLWLKLWGAGRQRRGEWKARRRPIRKNYNMSHKTEETQHWLSRIISTATSLPSVP